MNIKCYDEISGNKVAPLVDCSLSFNFIEMCLHFNSVYTVKGLSCWLFFFCNQCKCDENAEPEVRNVFEVVAVLKVWFLKKNFVVFCAESISNMTA